MEAETSDEHLGGYIRGGDPSTYFPHLWTWLCKGDDHSPSPRVRSVLDIGCGEGHSLRFFRDLGCEVLGVDGIAQSDPDIEQHDFAKGAWYPPRDKKFDLVWCCEFLEHVEEKYATNYSTALQAGRIILATHAFPGQGGHHHVNLRNQEYWEGFFAAIGFQLDDELTFRARSYASKDLSPWNHFLRGGMAFRRSL